jgi:hypothetical protein
LPPDPPAQAGIAVPARSRAINAPVRGGRAKDEKRLPDRLKVMVLCPAPPESGNRRPIYRPNFRAPSPLPGAAHVFAIVGKTAHARNREVLSATARTIREGRIRLPIRLFDCYFAMRTSRRILRCVSAMAEGERMSNID